MKNKLFSKSNMFLIILVMVIGFVINLPLFTKNILTADVLLNTTYYNAYSWEISLGRFGLFILGIFKSYLVIPHLEMFLSLAIVGAIAVLLIELFDIKSKYLKILIGIILVISPNVFTTLLFNYCSLAYTLAFLLSVSSIYVLFKVKDGIFKYLISIILLIFSLSIYQAYIQVAATLLLLMVLKELLEKKLDIGNLLKYILTMIISLVCYFIVMKVSLYLFNIDMSSYSGADKFGVTNILNIPKEIIKAYVTFYNYYFNDEIFNNTHLFNNVFNLLILVLFIVTLVYKSIKNKFKLKEYLLLFLIVLLLPVSINLVLLIIPNTKMQLLMAASYVLLFIFCIYLTKDLKHVKLILVILLMLLSRNFIIEGCSTIKTLEITYNKTYNIASNILDDIKDYDYRSNVMIVGNLDSNDYYNYTNNGPLNNLKKLNYGFVSNKSIFWDEYTNIKNGWIRFYDEYFGIYLNFVSLEDYNRILDSDEFKEMSVYPSKDSIRMIDNVVVVKIN